MRSLALKRPSVTKSTLLDSSLGSLSPRGNTDLAKSATDIWKTSATTTHKGLKMSLRKPFKKLAALHKSAKRLPVSSQPNLWEAVMDCAKHTEQVPGLSSTVSSKGIADSSKRNLTSLAQYKSSLLPTWLCRRKEFVEGYLQCESSELVDMADVCRRPRRLRSKYEQRVLLEWVSKVPDLRWVSRSRLIEMCNRLVTVCFSKGHYLMVKGSKGNCMYLILRGLAEVCLDNSGDCLTVEAGNAVGEASLRANGLRTASVVARSDIVALKLMKVDYDTIVLHEVLNERKDTCSVLQDTQFFRDLPHSKLERLASKADVKAYEAGQQVYSVGDASTSIYIVKSGSVKLETVATLQLSNKWPSGVRSWEQQSSFQRHTALWRVCKGGDVFGEKELLSRVDRNHSAATLEPTVLVVIDKDSFDKDFTQAEIQTLGTLNADRPDTPSRVKAVSLKVMKAKQLNKSLMDGLNYNPSPLGRDYCSRKGQRLERLNRLCKQLR